MQRVALDRADVPDTERRPRERMTVDELRRQPEQPPDLTHFVLEQPLDRLDQLELHILRETADVVVALDDAVRIAVERNALENIRVDRPLPEERSVDPGRRLGEDLDELLADDLALLLRIGDALELVEKTVRRIDITEVHI